MKDILLIADNDSAAVALKDLEKSETLENGLVLHDDIPRGHKIAVKPIRAGESVLKYGASIGVATADIASGAHIHTHNMKTGLSGISEYTYDGCKAKDFSLTNDLSPTKEQTFLGYLRSDGRVGTRNEIWIVPTVGCVNSAAARIAEKANALYGDLCDGVFAFSHPYGCSQLGEDGENTAKFLSAICRHPNAGGVLLISLGCENNNLSVMEKYLEGIDPERLLTVVTQDEEDEIAASLLKVHVLAQNAAKTKRTPQPLNTLVIGMKCGGSDAFSGLTANPLCGRIADRVCATGGSVLLSEVPEMFGAETALLSRCENKEIFDEGVLMINGFKEYFMRHNEPIYENPSPGNREGGITTLEEKSLGAVAKGGTSAVRGVLPLYGQVKSGGLSLLYGPGNDIVSSSNLAAAGASLILFTTGRGTPLGSFVPTIKLSSNTALAQRKPGWIDFDAGCVLSDGFDGAADGLLDVIIKTASGVPTKNELAGCREIAIFKDGVTL